jgi:hypothetical protein
MAKRLQFILQDSEYREIKRMAGSRQMSIAEWVRRALDLARRRETIIDPEKNWKQSAMLYDTTFPPAILKAC